MASDGWGVVGGAGCVRVNALPGAPSEPPCAPGVPGTLRAEDLVRTPAGALPREALLTTFVLDVAWTAHLLGPRCRTTVVADADPSRTRTIELSPRFTVVLAPVGDGGTGGGGGDVDGAVSGMNASATNATNTNQGKRTSPRPKKQPPRYQRPLQHAKLMVLRFDDRVRVAVSSANLTPGDWDAVGQCVWAADFARTDDLSTRGHFADALCAFLGTLLPRAQDALYWTSGYDTRSTPARPVYSAPGTAGRAGLSQLRTLLGAGAVRACTTLVAATSSLGVAHDAWRRLWPGAAPPAALRVVYPTAREMDARAAGVFFCAPRAARAAEGLLARLQWHDPRRAGLLSHAKTVFWLGGADGATPLAAYYGSANFSQAAWGAPGRDGALRANNYELGVLLVPEPAASPAAARALCPSPFVLPPPRYAPSDVPYQT